MAPIKISVNGLAEFMRAGSSRQRAMLRDYKYKTDRIGNKRPQIVWYSEARTAIRKYCASDGDADILIQATLKLQKKESSEPEGPGASRLRDNIRAIRAYAAQLNDKRFKIIDNPKPVYKRGVVEVSATPDLYVDDAGVAKLVKLHFSNKLPEAEIVNVVLKVMHEAAMSISLPVDPKNVIYVDIMRNKQYSGAKLNKRLKTDIDAACDTIADIWPRVTQS